jgi:hypothetical protein
MIVQTQLNSHSKMMKLKNKKKFQTKILGISVHFKIIIKDRKLKLRFLIFNKIITMTKSKMTF